MSVSPRWHVFATADQVAIEAAGRIESAAREAIAERGQFKIVLAGGSTPAKTYGHLVAIDTDWRRWHIFFGDERCLPADNPERNSVMARVAWLDQVSIPAENIHIMAAERGAEAAAEDYEPIVRRAVPFDLTLAGMGEDGHTASLFPGRQYTDKGCVLAVHDAPKPPPDRVSLSYSALKQSRRLMVLVTGRSKQAAVQGWRSGADLPIRQLTLNTAADVLLDASAIPE